MKVKVEQKHIDEGIPGRDESCAIACAINDMGYPSVIVEMPMVYIGEIAFRLPREANEWARRFDADQSSVKPFEFELLDVEVDES